MRIIPHTKTGKTIACRILGVAAGLAAVYFPLLLDAIHSSSLAFKIFRFVYFCVALFVFIAVMVRFVGSLFSQRIGEWVDTRPVAHAFWFSVGVGMILGIGAPMLIPQRAHSGPEYGVVQIHPDAPSSSIYIGLEEYHEQALYDAITKFGEGIAVVRCKPYHSRKPLATYAGKNIAIVVRSYPTSICITNHQIAVGGDLAIYERWGRDWLHWPTNGSRVILSGRSVRMPFTGIVWVSAFGTNDSYQEVKHVSEGLVAALRSAFTNRSVDMFMSDEKQP
jgi:hypothetical protein